MSDILIAIKLIPSSVVYNDALCTGSGNRMFLKFKVQPPRDLGEMQILVRKSGTVHLHF